MESPDIGTYLKESELIEKMYMNLLSGTTQKRIKRIDDGSTGLQNVEYRICVINSGNELLQRAILEKYNEWYENCRELFQEYTGTGRKSKIKDFAELYDKIVSLINLEDSIRKSNEKNHLKKEFIACFDSQVSMLHKIEPIIASSRNDQKRLLAAEIIHSELEETENLYEQGFIRSAGIVAGKALERYLKLLCEENELELKSEKPESILFSMAEKLHESGKVYEFDQEMLRTIEHLEAIRNKCVSPDSDEEPPADEVKELLDRTGEIIFLIFS